MIRDGNGRRSAEGAAGGVPGIDDEGGRDVEQNVQEVMSPDPIALPATSTAAEAAMAMRDATIGAVVVLDSNRNVFGIVTDRDIAVRAVAEGLDPTTAQLEQICSRALVTLAHTDSVEDAERVMRQQALRRLPVVDAGRAVGIVSLGDLARVRDPDSALADISTAPANG